MSHPRTRGERRALMDRWRRRLRGYLVVRSRMPGDDARILGLYLHTRTPCSCYMCGNERRHTKGVARFTVQERRAA
jgi:hypothetical protein